MTRLMALSALAILVIGPTWAGGEKADDAAAPETATNAEDDDRPIVFLHSLDNQPIEFTYRPDQKITEAVEHMHATGENLYAGNQAAIDEGKKLYMKYCKACHLKDGKGRIGPNLIDDKWRYERTATEKGRFETIYAGGAGAMQAFGRRIDQDQILKVMAFIDTLGEPKAE